MPHSFTKIWIHAIWSTKDRAPFLNEKVESFAHDLIRKQLTELDCPVQAINGMRDHVHCLFLLHPQKSIADVIKQVKGSTSHYINQHNLLRDKFAWQTGYAAYAVSESVRENVAHYIQKQKEHHLQKSFQQEYDAFLQVHGFEIIRQNENG